MQLYKECGETDVPIIVVKGLFSHPGDVALNEYFILTFFNTIAGLSLTHCYLWGVEFTKWDKLVIWWLFACDGAQNEWWWQIVWESQPDLGSILGQSGTWTTSHTLSPKMSFWIYNRHQKQYWPPYWLPVVVLNGSAMAAARMSSHNVVRTARLPFSCKVLLFVLFFNHYCCHHSCFSNNIGVILINTNLIVDALLFIYQHSWSSDDKLP